MLDNSAESGQIALSQTISLIETLTMLDEITQALQQTLDDRRLSRGERRSLSSVIEEANLTDQQRGVVRSTAFDLARKEMTNELEPVPILDWLEDVLRLLQAQTLNSKPGATADACFSPGNACRGKIRSLFRQARKSVDVCVFTITDNSISDEILAAHRRGVTIRIVSDNDKSADRGSDIPLLERLGVPVRMDLTSHHMHHKFAIFDDQILLTGSYNWTISASENNEENLIVTDDPSLVNPFRIEFHKLWQRFAPGR
ncbi:MAG: endonuclease [Planctomycetaceae bacterium]|nr:endonuclease [Planctomycetaceae bacterium]